VKTKEERQINWKIRKSKRKKEIKKFRQNYDIERKTNEKQANWGVFLLTIIHYLGSGAI
jgi:hypothetical protein